MQFITCLVKNGISAVQLVADQVEQTPKALIIKKASTALEEDNAFHKKALRDSQGKVWPETGCGTAPQRARDDQWGRECPQEPEQTELIVLDSCQSGVKVEKRAFPRFSTAFQAIHSGILTRLKSLLTRPVS
ncbi:hypothetical protein SKAU_G00058050 [Synaphobranchus kaupii]|uniref:Uncharacterized protein n=1 Tax=Synaphobranchus kaupii TaxID=118154 RepID=A0A9Q1JAF7_SYNKA|nr:hypothetical protein SKAU_G00058050 [Synaphobranchus kaupii]